MNCFVCGKKKEEYQVWNNKEVIGATHNSEFQNNKIIRNLSDKSVICHECMRIIVNEVERKKNNHALENYFDV